MFLSSSFIDYDIAVLDSLVREPSGRALAASGPFPSKDRQTRGGDRKEADAHSHPYSPIDCEAHVATETLLPLAVPEELFGAEVDVFTLVGVSRSLLLALCAVNGSWVVLSSPTSGCRRLARAVLVEQDGMEERERKTEGSGDGEQGPLPVIRLSPVLAFNLGIRGSWVERTKINIRKASLAELSCGAVAREDETERISLLSSLPVAGICPPMAEEAAVSRVISPASSPGELFADAVAEYFKAPRVLSVGDIIAIPIFSDELSQSAEFSVLDESLAAERASNADTPQALRQETALTSLPSSWMIERQQAKLRSLPLIRVPKTVAYFKVTRLTAGKEEQGRKRTAGGTKETLSLAWRVSRDETTLLQVGAIRSFIPREDLLLRFFRSYEEDRRRTRRARVGREDRKQLLRRDERDRDEFPYNDKVMKELEEVILPLVHPQAVKYFHLPLAALLYGPSGSRKSSLIRSLSLSHGLHLVEFLFSDLLGLSEAQTGENLLLLLKEAEEVAPCILHLRHIQSGGDANSQQEARLASLLSSHLRERARGTGEETLPVVIIGSATKEEDVSPALRACFTHEIRIDTPSEAEREKILSFFTRRVILDKDVSLKGLAQKTAGRTIGELHTLVADAGMRALQTSLSQMADRLLFSSTHEVGRNDSSPSISSSSSNAQITMQDLESALEHLATPGRSALGAAKIPNVRWEDIGGLADVKKEILDVVQLPLLHPELFASGVRQRSGILLYGPPGTGKTLLAKAVATECSLNFLSVKGPELLNMYIGESEKNVREVFQAARNAKPCVLFFDELDSLAPARGRGSDSGGVMDRVVSQLLTELDGVQRGEGGGGGDVFVIGATNRPDLLEPALLRPGRFDRLLYLGISADRESQLKIVKALTRKFTLEPDVDLREVVEQCPFRFTGADFYALCSNALANAIKRKVQAIEKHIAKVNLEDCYSSAPLTAAHYLSTLTEEESEIRVGREDFEFSLSVVTPSVSPEEIEHYEKLRKEYSSTDRK